MRSWSTLPLLLLMVLSMVVPAAGQEVQSCPLRSRSYRAQLVKTHLNATVNEAIGISFTLDPPEPPVGFFLSVKMTLRQAPIHAETKKPDILTGFPETTAVFRTPGRYRYQVIVSLIAKSSCGGVKADTIFNGEVRVQVKP